jgi:hypothetical protein
MSLRMIGRQTSGHGRNGSPLKIITFLITIVTLVGCSSLKPPSGMPSIAPEVKTSYGACPPIAGHYSNVGSAIGEDGSYLGSDSLNRLLFSTRPQIALSKSGSTAPPSSTPDSVTVSGLDQNEIQFNFFNGSSSIALLRQAKRGWWSHPFGYDCVSGFLILPAESGAGTFGLATYESTPLFLSKGADDSLIVQSSSTKGALIMVVPIWRTKTTWYRFPSLSETTETIPSHTPQAEDKNPSTSNHN